MKTPFRRIRLLFSFFLVGCFLFLNVSCGLDEFVYVESPVIVQEPSIESVYDGREFIFQTNESSMNSGSYSFIGTDVYYKIFVNKDQLNSVRNTLNNLAQNDSYSSAQRMIDTYKFQPLGKTGANTPILIPKSGTNRQVKIRLTNYGDTFPSHITVENSMIGIPQRCNGVGDYFFDFGNRTDEEASLKNRLPQIGDVDLVATESDVIGNEWYVCLYAVALCRDATYTMNYSKILYLGTVLIDSNEVYN